MGKYVWTTSAILTLAITLCLPAGTGAAVVTLQPGPEGKDSTVWYNSARPAHADWNFGVADYMFVEADPYHNIRRHGFLQFDLSGVSVVPEYITSASLSLLSSTYFQYADIGANVGIGLYKVTEDWNEGRGTGQDDPGQEGEITWNHQPSFDPTPVATINVPAGITQAQEAAGGVWHVWNSQDAGNAGFVNLVRDWVAGSTPNHGLMVRLTEPDNTTPRPYHKYRSSDYVGGPLHRPKLELGVPAEVIRSPYLQNATQNSVDVMWGSSDATGTLHWGASPGNYTHTVASTTILDTEGNYVHTAQIGGLSPGQTAYYYVDAVSQIIGQNDASYRATAAPAGNAPFRFIAYGDSQPKSTQEPPDGPDRWGYPEVMARMLPYNPALMVHAGDITDDGHLWQYNDWYFGPSASQGKSAPVYPVLGNHELRPGSNVQNFRDVYGLPVNSADGTEDYYSFDYGCVHFVALDTAIIPGGQTPDSTRAAQQNAWLQADLAATEKPWTVVWYHRSMTQYSYIDSLWRSTFEANGVDLVFAGHQHRYSSHLRNGIHYIITGGAGSLLDGNPYYQDGWSSYNRGKSFSDDFHFIVIDALIADGHYQLELNVYDTDNVLRDTITIAGAAIPVPGDANDDGVVNDADASILAAHWQQTGMGWEHGDFNYDGIVNDQDASIMAAHWLQTREGNDSPVPEPAGVVLLLGGMVSLLLLVLQRRVTSGT
jgi:predicted phosphodiesterase